MKLLCETATATKTATGRWRAILAVPGQGSSGKYTAEMLQRFGPAALPAGMKAYITHNESRDPRDLLGSYPDGAFWDAEEGVAGALVSELEPLPSRVAFVEEVAPHVGLSLFALGKVDKDGIVTELAYDRMNGVDMVGYAGLDGSSIGSRISERAISLLEIARAADLADERKKDSMTPEEMATALAEALAPVIASVSELKLAVEAAKPAEKLEDESLAQTAEQAVAAYATAAETVRKAKLLPSQEKALLAEAVKGNDITVALEAAKATKDEALAFVTEAAPTAGGRRVDAGIDSNDYTLGMGF